MAQDRPVAPDGAPASGVEAGPPQRGTRGEVVLELKGITKQFPGVKAVDDVSLEVAKGEVLALLGENGAGKTTLMNIVDGLLEPDGGSIVVRGKQVEIKNPREAIELGIGMVHQHFMLVEPFTVAENIMLGVEPTTAGAVIDRKTARRRVVEISDRYGLKVDPDAVVMGLSVGLQQRVEILRTLYRDIEILILDEPTAVLTPQEVRELFVIVRQLVAEGLSVVIITHKLDEVMAFADRIAVMRQGALVGETRPSECDEQRLAKMMVGRDVVLRIDKTPASPGEPVLEIVDLQVLDDRKLEAVSGVNLTVHAGEIVGVAGVDGNGQRELVESIVGLRKQQRGSVSIRGAALKPGDPAGAIDAGVALVPEDRQRRGLVLEFDLVENLALGQQSKPPYAKAGILDRAAMERVANERIAAYDIRTPSSHVAAANLSGGNQQKVVLARELGRDPDVLIASQPTRGLDVGAIEFVHRRIVEERDSGKAVLMISMELEEVLSLSDRIVVMYEGRIVAEFEGGRVTEEELGYYMTGGGKADENPDQGRAVSDLPEGLNV